MTDRSRSPSPSPSPARDNSSGTGGPRITPAAYFGTLLHAFKHVDKPILGLLLASSAHPALVTRTVPLTHAPLARAASTLDLATAILAPALKEAGLDVAGVYVSPLAGTTTRGKEVPLDSSVLTVAGQVLERVGAPNGFVALLDTAKIVDHSLMALSSATPGIRLTLHAPPSTLKRLVDVLPVAEDFFDLDDHFEDITRDWIGNPLVWRLMDQVLQE